MKIKLVFLYLFLCYFTFGQNSLETGISVGSSDIFRKEDNSFYNYENKEIAVFLTRNFAWKKNEEDRFKKFWMLQPQIYFGNYHFIATDQQQNPFRAIFFGGLKFQKPLENFSIHSKFFIGTGYQSGYANRLPGGIYFTEKINLGFEFKLKNNFKPFLDLGVMHVSNGNLYEINRGLEVFFLELGLQFPYNREN